jgi:microsomal dipeptidase-like Zn-dependent dipeptidase
MIVDLHAHYPMHLVPDGKSSVWRLLRSRRERLRLRDRIRAILVGLASLFINYRSPFSGPRIRIEYMQEGGVNVGLSVLFSFFDEADVLDGPLPKPGYIDSILAQLDFVTDHVREKHAGDAFIATNPEALSSAGDDGQVALVHCVEGGYHLGATPQEVTESVERLASRGVAYIILAHLIWRGVATDARAIPFLSDKTYDKWFPQPDEGLSDLGRAAVEAMAREHVVIDLSHMSERSIEDTLDMLDELDPKAPVYATHAGYRFGKQEYMLNESQIKRIAERGGVIGLILARYQLEDGPPPEVPGHRARLRKEKRFEDSFETIRAHLDKICEITGSHRFTAIGSDFDGFIKPTLAGLEDMRDMARLEAALKAHYGPEDAKLICSENALRPLRTYWRGSPS